MTCFQKHPGGGRHRGDGDSSTSVAVRWGSPVPARDESLATADPPDHPTGGGDGSVLSKTTHAALVVFLVRMFIPARITRRRLLSEHSFVLRQHLRWRRAPLDAWALEDLRHSDQASGRGRGGPPQPSEVRRTVRDQSSPAPGTPIRRPPCSRRSAGVDGISGPVESTPTRHDRRHPRLVAAAIQVRLARCSRPGRSEPDARRRGPGTRRRPPRGSEPARLGADGLQVPIP